MPADDIGFQSIAFPLVGAGSGGFNQEKAELQKLDSLLEVSIVEFKQCRIDFPPNSPAERV